MVKGTNQPQFNANTICDIQIPIPSLETQQKIVDEMEKKVSYIKQTEELIIRQQEKIKKVMSKIWQKH